MALFCCRSAALPLNEERLGAEVVAGRGERGILYPDFPRKNRCLGVFGRDEGICSLLGSPAGALLVIGGEEGFGILISTVCDCPGAMVPVFVKPFSSRVGLSMSLPGALT